VQRFGEGIHSAIEGEPDLNTNSVKARLKKGEVVVGSILNIPSARLAELAALCGFDYVAIDQEHGPIGIDVVEDMVRAVELHNVVPIVRVPSLQSHLILQALDAGAMGLHIPNVNTADDARKAVRFSKYAPAGERGLAGVRAARYGLQEKLADYCHQANNETMVIVHIESLEAVHNLDEMLTVEGVDVYFVGPSDLSNSLGRPGVFDAAHQTVVDDTMARILKAGKVAGFIAPDAEVTRRYIEKGVRYLTNSTLQLMTTAAKSFLKTVKG
jgi:2-keto-3-deoxy-L-rhamnonate aldolase RhmA